MSSTALARARPPTPGVVRVASSSTTLRYPIRTKLLLGFGSVILLMILNSAAGVFNVAQVNALGSRMYDDHLSDIRDLTEAQASVSDLDGQLLRTLLDPNAQNRAGYAAAAESDIASINRLIGDFKSTALLAQEKKPLAGFDADWRQYQDTYHAVAKVAAAGDSAAASKQYLDQLAPLAAKVNSNLAQLVQINETEAKNANDQIELDLPNRADAEHRPRGRHPRRRRRDCITALARRSTHR